jgi:hypothetical protein
MASAEMFAVNCVGLTNVVVMLAAPSKLMIDAGTKLLPLIVRVKDAPPAKAVLGEIVVIAGLGFEAVGLDGVVFDGVAVEAVPPPHPAREMRLTTPEITSPRISAALLFIVTLLCSRRCSEERAGSLRARVLPDRDGNICVPCGSIHRRSSVGQILSTANLLIPNGLGFETGAAVGPTKRLET